MDVVPLQPKTCKMCKETKKKMDFTSKSNFCNACIKIRRKENEIKGSGKEKTCKNLWINVTREADKL